MVKMVANFANFENPSFLDDDADLFCVSGSTTPRRTQTLIHDKSCSVASSGSAASVNPSFHSNVGRRESRDRNLDKITTFNGNINLHSESTSLTDVRPHNIDTAVRFHWLFPTVNDGVDTKSATSDCKFHSEAGGLLPMAVCNSDELLRSIVSGLRVRVNTAEQEQKVLMAYLLESEQRESDLREAQIDGQLQQRNLEQHLAFVLSENSSSPNSLALTNPTKHIARSLAVLRGLALEHAVASQQQTTHLNSALQSQLEQTRRELSRAISHRETHGVTLLEECARLRTENDQAYRDDLKLCMNTRALSQTESTISVLQQQWMDERADQRALGQAQEQQHVTMRSHLEEVESAFDGSNREKSEIQSELNATRSSLTSLKERLFVEQRDRLAAEEQRETLRLENQQLKSSTHVSASDHRHRVELDSLQNLASQQQNELRHQLSVALQNHQPHIHQIFATPSSIPAISGADLIDGSSVHMSNSTSFVLSQEQWCVAWTNITLALEEKNAEVSVLQQRLIEYSRPDPVLPHHTLSREPHLYSFESPVKSQVQSHAIVNGANETPQLSVHDLFTTPMPSPPPFNPRDAASNAVIGSVFDCPAVTGPTNHTGLFSNGDLFASSPLLPTASDVASLADASAGFVPHFAALSLSQLTTPMAPMLNPAPNHMLMSLTPHRSLPTGSRRILDAQFAATQNRHRSDVTDVPRPGLVMQSLDSKCSQTASVDDGDEGVPDTSELLFSMHRLSQQLRGAHSQLNDCQIQQRADQNTIDELRGQMERRSVTAGVLPFAIPSTIVGVACQTEFDAVASTSSNIPLTSEDRTALEAAASECRALRELNSRLLQRVISAGNGVTNTSHSAQPIPNHDISPLSLSDALPKTRVSGLNSKSTHSLSLRLSALRTSLQRLSSVPASIESKFVRSDTNALIEDTSEVFEDRALFDVVPLSFPRIQLNSSNSARRQFDLEADSATSFAFSRQHYSAFRSPAVRPDPHKASEAFSFCESGSEIQTTPSHHSDDLFVP